MIRLPTNAKVRFYHNTIRSKYSRVADARTAVDRLKFVQTAGYGNIDNRFYNGYTMVIMLTIFCVLR